ncbi:SH3 beta-barrel fold-containing protein [Larkinella knui]|nr:SH3 beta-barrel fold-containing protein [Larkinella knui]
MKSQVMKLAALLRKAGSSLSDAVRRAWETIKLRAKLAKTDEKGMWIKFKKADGTIREALATRNIAVIPTEHRPKSGDVAGSIGITITYFDILCDGWRSFRADRLIFS